MLTDASGHLIAVNGSGTFVNLVDTQLGYVVPLGNDTNGFNNTDSNPYILDQVASNPDSPDSMFVTVSLNMSYQGFGVLNLTTGQVTLISTFNFRAECKQLRL